MPRKANHEPTAQTRQQVEDLVGFGLTYEQIGHVLGCSHDTVQRYYRAELEAGHAIALATVAKTAYQMAVSGEWPAMTCFWLKTRAGWKEVQHHEVTGKDSGPVQINWPLPRTPLDD